NRKSKNVLKRYIRDMWSYFQDYVDKENHFLPPDHIVLSPVERVVNRTSPTNIGLYLVSILAAADLRLISPAEMKNRLEQTLDTLENLPKYKGHLYNWYDT
ncbi:MAG TPA: hypothetical protein DCY75_10840, partial [Clostridiales bacterium]|nr:hypothetical protein [Clostridiales bacterium]